MLLEQHSVSEKANDKTFSSGVINIILAPTLFFCDVLSNNIFHSSDISVNKTSLSDMSLKTYINRENDDQQEN